MMTVTEAARHKGVSRDSVLKAIREHKLAKVQKGGIYFVRRSDLDKWKVIGHRPKKDGTSPPRPGTTYGGGSE